MKNSSLIIVMKFGGAALANYESMNKTARIINSYRKKQKDIVIVVSAMKGITEKLYEAVTYIAEKKTNLAISVVDDIYQQHVSILEKNASLISGYAVQQQIKYLTDLLKIFIKKLYTPTLSQGQIDYIVSFGERLNVHLFSFVLSKYIPSPLAIDASNILVTNKKFGNAKPLLSANKKALQRILYSCLQTNVIPIVTGYVGRAEDGCITTLGRGGSDYTASFIAYLLKANKIIFWKDVLGLYDKDPKKFKYAQLLRSATYDKAISLAQNGAQVLHPDSISPLKKAHIPALIKSFLFPNKEGTTIWQQKINVS